MLSATNNVSWMKKHSLKSKWNILFDKSPEWISFKPQLGLKVFPCYSCKNMFSSKLTFQDHINRRVIIIKYKCSDCSNTLTFYNRCSFHLHARKHFPLAQGQINLENVDIHLLPVDLAGFARHENIPFLYDEDEEFSYDQSYINCQFYTPDDSEAGKQFITLKPFNLVFHYAEGQNLVLLVLKQISNNVPLCEFVTQNRVNPPDTPMSNGILEPEIKQEVDDEEFTIPVISKIESLNKENVCSECGVVLEETIESHLLGNNRPLNESIVCSTCKFVAPTRCSLKAHIRAHDHESPHVCPECGKMFSSSNLLNSHVENVCFHFSKNVRYKCPALKCGKLFVLPSTFTAHFINHINCSYICNVCSLLFNNEQQFQEHSKNHTSSTYIRQYNCLVCKDKSAMNYEESTKHMSWHLQDRERCVYIFTCKFCRSFFRSAATFSVHKKRCNKVGNFLLLVNCQFCPAKINFKEKENFKTCPSCKQINQVTLRKRLVNLPDAKTTCMLCKTELTPEEKKNHSSVCKYNNPVVNVQTLGDSEETSSSDKMSDDSKPSTFESSNDSIKTSDTPKVKKRKRSSGSGGSKAGKRLDESIELQAEGPVIFDGTYVCKLCGYKNTDRTQFHNHIITHRDISTAYQCMECGHCFVVKPSLIKHLAHFHKIVETDTYFTENNCYDKSAIETLENNLKMVPGEYSGPIKENQCSMCLEQFPDTASLNKHFRIHGMAFLLKKTK